MTAHGTRGEKRGGIHGFGWNRIAPGSLAYSEKPRNCPLQVEPNTVAQPVGPRQFSLRAVFAATTWIASITGLAVSHVAGWTMFAVGFSLACFNCAGWLAPCHKQTAQTRLFHAAWLLLIASLLLPAVQGCGTTVTPGWHAAVICCEAPFMSLFGETVNDWCGYGLYSMLALANLLLALSPLFLCRLRNAKGQAYGALFVTAASAMWCCSMHDTEKFLVGYYAWCSAGLAMLCAFRMRWAVLPLLALAPLLACLAR